MNLKTAIVDCRLVKHEWRHYADRNDVITKKECEMCGLSIPLPG